MIIKFLIFLTITSFTFTLPQSKEIDLIPDEDYPLWIKQDEIHSNQTSGITFIKEENCKRYFLIADDIGDLHSLVIDHQNNLELNSITFSDSVQSFISQLPKADFEEITFDQHTKSFYLSIEGNGKEYQNHVGIYKIEFTSGDIPFTEVTKLSKINFEPEDLFLKYTKPNIGYEGFAVDENYFYLGLEGFTENYQFADSAVIFIAIKSENKIIKEISTKDLNIHTICGLFSDQNYSLWGIDRNKRKIFHINFDENFEIIDFNTYDCATNIPGYKEYNYNPSFESITIDSSGFLYLVDDPWREAFIPSEDILNKLDEQTVKNFKELIPTIFRYKIKLN
jgi:hypothetical protein